MRLTEYLRAGQWPTVLGYLLFVAVQIVAVTVGFGAVLFTYSGVRRFEPATVPGVRP